MSAEDLSPVAAQGLRNVRAALTTRTRPTDPDDPTRARAIAVARNQRKATKEQK